MTRVRSTCVATLAAAALIGVTVLAQKAPEMKPILAGKSFTPPAQGLVEVDFTKPVTKRDKEMVVTKIQVRNTMKAPIARLTVDETWYDKGGALVTGSKGIINGLLQPDEVQTVEIRTPYDAKMSANNYNFTHANGGVKPHRVDKIGGPDAKDAPKAAAAPAKPAAKKK
ncbi:MAG: hypothetical protein HY048_10315 [Acidobacteria bacterium]|nr:hypothetical protein [Acidobacteriota bacterium]